MPNIYIHIYVCAAAKSLQSCPTLCDPIDGSPPGSPVPGILQARTLEWVAISFSNAGKWKSESEKVKWSRSVVSDPQWPHGLQPTRLLHPWDFPGKSTGVGCHCLLWYMCVYLLKLFYFVSGYSRLTMLWQFQLNNQGTQPYIYMYPFSPKLPSHPGCHITLSRVPSESTIAF